MKKNKVKAQKSVTALPPSPIEKRLPNKVARDRFHANIHSREPCPERGFLFSRMPKSLFKILRQLKWESLAKQPSKALRELTWEFYSGIPPKKSGVAKTDFSFVRGKKVSFSASTINQHFGLDYDGDAFEEALEQVTEAQMERYLQMLTVPGSEWLVKTASNYKVKGMDLRPIPKVLYLFVRSTILPTIYCGNVHMERLFLLGYILERKPVNIGKLIEREILASARRKKGSLFFPCLIYDLCLIANVDVYGGEEIVSLRKPIATGKLKHEVEVEIPIEENAGAAPAVVAPGEENATNAAVLALFQHNMKQHQAYWTFAKVSHEWLVREFANNSKGKVPNPPPEFPSWILEEKIPSPEATAPPQHATPKQTHASTTAMPTHSTQVHKRKNVPASRTRQTKAYCEEERNKNSEEEINEEETEKEDDDEQSEEEESEKNEGGDETPKEKSISEELADDQTVVEEEVSNEEAGSKVKCPIAASATTVAEVPEPVSVSDAPVAANAATAAPDFVNVAEAPVVTAAAVASNALPKEAAVGPKRKRIKMFAHKVKPDKKSKRDTTPEDSWSPPPPPSAKDSPECEIIGEVKGNKATGSKGTRHSARLRARV